MFSTLYFQFNKQYFYIVKSVNCKSELQEN